MTMTKRSLTAVVTGVEGYLDVAFCCYFLVRLPVVTSLLWGLLGGLALAALYLAFVAGATSLGMSVDDDEPDDEDGSLKSLLDDTLPVAETGKKDPWYIDWPLSALIVVGVAVAAVLVFITGRFRTVLTVAAFAVAVPDVWWVSVLGVLFVSVAIQFMIAFLAVDPYAKRHGIEM